MNSLDPFTSYICSTAEDNNNCPTVDIICKQISIHIISIFGVFLEQRYVSTVDTIVLRSMHIF